MTYIEFFDNNAIENICSCLVSAPDRVILIGENEKKMQLHAQRYHSLFQKRGTNIEFTCMTVNKNHQQEKNRLQKIVDLLADIVDKYEDEECVFDLSGGDDLMLVAVGIIYYRYRDKNIQLSRINLRTGGLYDCDKDGVLIPREHDPMLKIDEYIRVFGGKVVYEREKVSKTRRWDWTEEFLEDIISMWQICRENVHDWNTQMDTFAVTDIVPPSDIVTELLEKRLITGDRLKNGFYLITYKNDQIKECLTTAGLVLELYITVKARMARDGAGKRIYNDVCNGVVIDWDGVSYRKGGTYVTMNEIDVIMMHKLIPVFVSCKNGNVRMEELYKLNTVAERFGGKYAKKVLVANALGGDTFSASLFRQRAKDMGIRLIENVQDMTEEKVEKEIENLWRKKYRIKKIPRL